MYDLEQVEKLLKDAIALLPGELEDTKATLKNALTDIEDAIYETHYDDDYRYEQIHDPGYMYDLTHEPDYEPYDDEYYDYAEFMAEMDRDDYED